MALNLTVLREWILRIIPMVVVAFLTIGSLGSLPSLVAPSNPVIGWIEEGHAYFNQNYTISFTSDMACDWSYDGVTWLSAASSLENARNIVLTGNAKEIGCFSIDVTATKHNDSALATHLSVPVNVTETDSWGYIETFSEMKTGTRGNATIGNVVMTKGVNTESVVLDGFVWVMSRGTEKDAKDIIYEAPLPSGSKGWNLSYELYAPKENGAFEAGTDIDRFSIRSYLLNENGSRLTGVELSFGSPNESIAIYNASGKNWTNISQQILPSCTHESETEGFKPDRYVVSYEYTVPGKCQITIWHTYAGKIFKGNVSIDGSPISSPRLGIYSDATLSNSMAGAWIVDNIAFRSATTRYPIVEPEYEYVYEDEPVWVEVRDSAGKAIRDAIVTIEGLYATFNLISERYESLLLRKPDWGETINYTVTVDGVGMKDSMKVTFMSQNVESVGIEKWWNGWDWVTVMGLDDATTATSAIYCYRKYQHPTTAYLTDASGDSENILNTQSEIALHYPHEYSTMPVMFWDEAVAAAEKGHARLSDRYSFASRWDDPTYVGVGDMYISMANPGNSASFQLMFAEYSKGTRIDGVSSNPVPGSKSAGNSSLIGSWWVPEPGVWSVPDGDAWTPHTRIDLMDADRAIRTEGVAEECGIWPTIFYIAERHGLLRVYTHQKDLSSPSLSIPFLDWIDDEKSNYSLENWKATDGEVASYIYGGWSTAVHLNVRSSDADTKVFDISRKNPIEAGYWRVPITISFNASIRYGGVEDIVIEEGARILKASDGSLKNLSGKRVMDVGYDIREGKVYVSYFWNESSVLRLSFKKEQIQTSPLSVIEIASASSGIIGQPIPILTQCGQEIMGELSLAQYYLGCPTAPIWQRCAGNRYGIPNGTANAFPWPNCAPFF